MNSFSFSVALALTRVVDSRTGVEALGWGGGLAGAYPLLGPRTGVMTPGSGRELEGRDTHTGTRTRVDTPKSGGDTGTRTGPCTGVVTHVSRGEGADDGRGTGVEVKELISGLSPLMVSMAAEIFEVLIDPVGGEAARLEVGELSATGTTVKSRWDGAVDVGDDIGAWTMALVHDCLVLVASKAKCVSCEPIRDGSGKLEGTILVLMRGT